jgi:hypothetical protein
MQNRRGMDGKQNEPKPNTQRLAARNESRNAKTSGKLADAPSAAAKGY